MAMVNIEKGQSIHDCPRCDPYYGGCVYYEEGYCIYNIATIKQRISRACYEDEVQADIEARLDYEEGMSL